MKKACLYILLVFFFACEESNTVDYGYDNYYENLATATAEKDVFLLDNGKILINTNKETSKAFEKNDRVFLHYTLLKETTTGYDETIRINASAKIPLGKLSSANQTEINDAPDEPVFFESAWVGSHYLNMQLYINRLSEAHSVGLLADSASLKTDTIRLFFKHDRKNDPSGYWTHLILSFELEELAGRPIPEKAKTLLLNVNTSNYGDKTVQLNY